MDGRPILSLREIHPDTRALIVSHKKQFKGVYHSSRVMNYNDHKVFKSK